MKALLFVARELDEKSEQFILTASAENLLIFVPQNAVEGKNMENLIKSSSMGVNER
jgi:hypothetical protein